MAEGSAGRFRLVGSSPAPLVMITEELRDRWEAAYRLYTDTVDSHGAHATASASWQVARAWRDIAEHAGSLPWWLRAALETAAEAYEEQAREFNRQAHTAEHGSAQRDGAWRHGR